MRARKHQIIRKPRRGDAHVRFRFVGPRVLQIPTIIPYNGEPRPERGVEARRADQNVDGIDVAVAANARILGDLDNLALDELDVVRLERLQILRARRQPPTADRPFGHELRLQGFVVPQLVVHRLQDEPAQITLELAVRDQEAEEPVHADFVALAQLEQGSRLVGKVVEFLGGVGAVRFARGDPVGLADEVGDPLDERLDGGKDLDAGGPLTWKSGILMVCGI